MTSHRVTLMFWKNFCTIVLIFIDVHTLGINEFPPKFVPNEDPSIPNGHLKPFGYQRPPDGPVQEYDTVLHPRDFWDRHVSKNKPAVFRKAIAKSTALSHWSDEYLKQNYGDLDVLIELKKENRSISAQRTSLGTFIDNYKEKDVYVVTVLPDPMRKEIQVPSCILCGTFVDFIHETNFWMSSGGTRSVIHFDADLILHCLVAGRKDWMLVNQRHVEDLYMEQREKFSGSGHTLLDPDKVDMVKYPRVANVSWQYTTLLPGDCVFLPSEYIHQVRSYVRSISATMLFTLDKDEKFNPKGCDNINLNSLVTLDKVHVHWTYNQGDKVIEMGYMNVEMLRDSIFAAMKNFNSDKLTFDIFKKFWHHSIDNDDINEPRKVFDKYFDVHKKGFLTKEEVLALPVDNLKDLARAMDPPHGPTQDKKLAGDSLLDIKNNNDDKDEINGQERVEL